MTLRRWVWWPLRLVRFGLWFFWELLQANALVAWEVSTPRYNMRPGIVAIPTRCRTALETTLLANLISLTPGTLTIEVSDDERVLYVHALHLRTPDALRASISRFEDELFRVTR